MMSGIVKALVQAKLIVSRGAQHDVVIGFKDRNIEPKRPEACRNMASIPSGADHSKSKTHFLSPKDDMSISSTRIAGHVRRLN